LARRFIFLAAFLALPAFAADAPFFRVIEAEASLETDGSITLTEKKVIENPTAAPAVIKHRYWTDPDEKIQLVSIVPAAPYKLQTWGQLEMTVPPGVTTYTITTRITGAVTPVWAVPRGERDMNSNAFVTDPRDRIREILPIWKDRGPNPRSRYLFDYQYFFPEQAETYAVNPSISFGKEWKPAHTIKAGAIGAQIKGSTGWPDSFRIRHLFDYQNAGAPAAIDLRKYAIRTGAIVLFPIAAVLIWLAYFVSASLRGHSGRSEIDDRWLRENILNQPPEIIRAKWTGSTQPPSIEDALRRMEKEGKISLDVQTVNSEEDDYLVTVKLRVDRSRLSSFERCVIDSLMPGADEITSKDVEKAHAGQDFDPMDAATDWLERSVPALKRARKAPRAARVITGLLFLGGIVSMFVDVARTHQFPVALVGALIATNVFVALWPILGNARVSMVLAVIPFAVFLAIVIAAQALTYQPLGEFASAGVTLIALGGFHGLLSTAAKGEGQPAELVQARDWFREQPQPREEWIPYLEALGLRDTKTSNEDWGYAFCTYADN
jgi:hypothetical protein